MLNNAAGAIQEILLALLGRLENLGAGMAMNKMLILDRGLVERIDENRGDLTRAEFVEICIDGCLEGVPPQKAQREERHAGEQRFTTRQEEAPVYATREEFQDFKRSMRPSQGLPRFLYHLRPGLGYWHDH